MGFLDSLKSVFSIESEEAPEQSKTKIPQQYLAEFQQSAEGQLQLIEANLYRIELVYPVGAKEITETIAQIRENLEKNVAKIEIDSQLTSLQETVKKYTKKANQRYSINEVKKTIDRLQKANNTVIAEHSSKFIFKDALETEEQYIQSVSNRISDFEGQERDLLIASLMEAHYRIAIGKLYKLE